MRAILTGLMIFVALPVVADVEEALADHVLPGFRTFAADTAQLAEAAREDCTAEALQPAFHTAFDAWLGVAHLGFGPLEEEGRGLAIAFWPDTRAMTPRVLGGLIADADPIVESPAEFAEVSVAGRGLFALEQLLFDERFSGYGAESYSCALAIAIAADLARMGAEVAAGWDSFAETMRSAGEAGNTRFLTGDEPRRALYTALMTGLEFTEDQRLGRPLGTFDGPRPERAEARRSGRPLRNVTLSLAALRDLARTLADRPIPETEAAFDAAMQAAGRVEAPDFSGIADPSERLRVEALQQRVAEIRRTVSAEIGAPMGLSQGFNSADGD